MENGLSDSDFRNKAVQRSVLIELALVVAGLRWNLFILVSFSNIIDLFGHYHNYLNIQCSQFLSHNYFFNSPDGRYRCGCYK